MANMIIDANIFKAIYEEDIGMPPPRPERTGEAGSIFRSDSPTKIAFIDNENQIEHEWRNQCLGGGEWFEAWLAEKFASGKIRLLDVAGCHQDAIKVRKIGFPSNAKDIWYIKVAYAAKRDRAQFNTLLITEDIDFYDPAQKKAKNKIKIIKSGGGVVAKYLKKENVNVVCLSTFIDKF